MDEVFDVTDEHFVLFPGHKVFLNELNAAKETACKNKSRVYVNWRGYRGFVTPGKKKLEKNDFLKHLTVALKVIKPLSNEEEEVHFVIIYLRCTTM